MAVVAIRDDVSKCTFIGLYLNIYSDSIILNVDICIHTGTQFNVYCSWLDAHEAIGNRER